MKNKLLCLFTIAVILAIGCISIGGGCSCNDGHEVYNYPEHESENDDYVTSTVLPSEEDLGVPVYDENLDPSSVESSESTSNGEVTDAGVDYDTKDDFETVVSWYKEKLGPPSDFQQLPDGHNQAWWTMEKDGKQIQVIITCTDTGTAISILTSKL